MEILYNQYYKSGAKGTAFAEEKAMALDFIKNDSEHHDIGFKYEDEEKARKCVPILRNLLRKEFSGGGYARFRFS